MTNEQLRLIEALLVIYEREKPNKPWGEWLAQKLKEPEPPENDLPMPHRLESAIRGAFHQTFYVRLQLDRIESMLLMLLDKTAPTMTFDEVKTLFGPDAAEVGVKEWLAGNSIVADASGLFPRAAVLRAFGNPPIGSDE